MRAVGQFCICLVIFSIAATGQSTDVTGWADLTWGVTSTAAQKLLRPLGVRPCQPTKMTCAEGASTEALIIDKYNFNTVSFSVKLLFIPKNGLNKAIMTAANKQDAFDKILSALTKRYGKPGLQSEYNGDDEEARTTWIWTKPHGKVSLEADDAAGVFTLTYEAPL